MATTIQTRRRRRLAILLSVILLLAGSVVVAVYATQWKSRQQTQHQRAEGIAAFERGEYGTAIRTLGGYLNRNQDDADAWHYYAQANLNAPAPTPRQVREAMNGLTRFLRLRPNDRDAAAQLMELLKLAGRDEDALTYANRILENHPDDRAALSSKAVLLTRLGREEEAMPIAQQALEREPDNVAIRMLTYQLRFNLGETAGAIVDDARALAEQTPGDPRYEMLVGYAYAMARNNAESVRWLRQAADRALEDQQFAFTLVQVLDASRLFAESLRVLTRAATPDNEAGLFSEMARRLFEAQRYGELVDRLSMIDPAQPNTRVEEVALRAMGLYSLDRRSEADAIVAALRNRRGEPAATVWASVLQVTYSDQRPPVPEVIRTLNQSLQTIPTNAYAHAFLGDAYASTGDNELALASWRRAADLRPSWAAVRALIARTLVTAGRPDEALEFAEAAMARNPGSVDAAITFIRVRAALLADRDRAGAEELLAMVDEVQEAVPGEPQTLLIRVQLLAHAGRSEDAARAVDDIVSGQTQLSPTMLLQLAEASRRAGLGLENDLLARAQAQGGQTPELAMAQARQLAREGRIAEGLALLEDGARAAGGAEAGPWRLNIAVYLEGVGDPRAAEAWQRLTRDYPENQNVQMAALRARSVRNDRAFTGQVIDRLEKLMGADSVAFRLERARWLLESSAVERDAATAVSVLREVINDAPRRLEPRLLLANALERLDREQVAIRELRAADQAIPGNPAILLELARLHQNLRQFPNAREAIDQALSLPTITVDQRRTVAVLLARQGDESRAIQTLEQMVRGQESPPDDVKLMLASLYFRSGQTGRAEQIVDRLLTGSPSPAAVLFALQVQQSMGNPQGVERVMRRLEQSDLPEAEQVNVLAEFHAQVGDTDRAVALFERVAAESPQNVENWRRIVALRLRQGDAAAAVEAARRGLTHVPGDAGLAAVRDNAQLVMAASGDESLRLVTAMLLEPADRAVAVEALRAAGVPAEDARGRAERARRLRAVADQHPSRLPLQIAAGRAHLRAGQFDEAAAVGSRATRAFPTAVEPAWLFTEALASQNRWVDVLGAASEWRSRSSGAPIGPDLMMAEAQLRLGQASAALQRLQPYVAAATANPAEHVEVVSRYARALIATGRVADATNLVLPALPQSQPLRVLALQVAASDIPDAAVAERWLTQVETHTPADETFHRTLLAQSWWTLGQRSIRSGFERSSMT
jgi:tetratricopeptide (TPR) repeat protein